MDSNKSTIISHRERREFSQAIEFPNHSFAMIAARLRMNGTKGQSSARVQSL